jgi:hypothetical protein
MQKPKMAPHLLVNNRIMTVVLPLKCSKIVRI